MHKQTVDPKVDLVVVIGEPWNGYQQARVVLTDPQGSRCVDVLNLEMGDAADLKDLNPHLVEAVRNPDGIEALVLSLMMDSPTGAVKEGDLKARVIGHYQGDPDQAIVEAVKYFAALEEPPESDDLIAAAIDRAGAFWYMCGWVICTTADPDLWQQTKPGRVLREVALGSDPIAEVS